jgi:hypothetical protein
MYAFASAVLGAGVHSLLHLHHGLVGPLSHRAEESNDMCTWRLDVYVQAKRTDIARDTGDQLSVNSKI